MDSVVSAKESGTTKRFLTMSEWLTRMDLIFLMQDGKMESVVRVLDGLEKKLGTDMFRRKVPKGMDFLDMTQDGALAAQRWMNEYPRGVLEGRSARRVLLELAKQTGIVGLDQLL